MRNEYRKQDFSALELGKFYAEAATEKAANCDGSNQISKPANQGGVLDSVDAYFKAIHTHGRASPAFAAVTESLTAAVSALRHQMRLMTFITHSAEIR